MTDVEPQKRWLVTRTLLEGARRALPVSPKQEYVTLLARYRGFLEHNEFDSDRPGPRASRAQSFLVPRNPASARTPGSITGCWMPDEEIWSRELG
jgi:hypothetical protein